MIADNYEHYKYTTNGPSNSHKSCFECHLNITTQVEDDEALPIARGRDAARVFIAASLTIPACLIHEEL